MSSNESPDGLLLFEGMFRGDDVEQRICGMILQTHELTTANAIADAANYDPRTARKYLGWFGELGIVIRHSSHPAAYKRNDVYFEWRQINQPATDYSVEDLQQRVRELSSWIEGYKDTYGASTPAAVDAITVTQPSDDRTIDDVYGDLGDWVTARSERTRYEHVRQ